MLVVDFEVAGLAGLVVLIAGSEAAEIVVMLVSLAGPTFDHVDIAEPDS